MNGNVLQRELSTMDHSKIYYAKHEDTAPLGGTIQIDHPSMQRQPDRSKKFIHVAAKPSTLNGGFLTNEPTSSVTNMLIQSSRSKT